MDFYDPATVVEGNSHIPDHAMPELRVFALWHSKVAVGPPTLFTKELIDFGARHPRFDAIAIHPRDVSLKGPIPTHRDGNRDRA
jgi:hypothetical protein